MVVKQIRPLIATLFSNAAPYGTLLNVIKLTRVAIDAAVYMYI